MASRTCPVQKTKYLQAQNNNVISEAASGIENVSMEKRFKTIRNKIETTMKLRVTAPRAYENETTWDSRRSTKTKLRGTARDQNRKQNYAGQPEIRNENKITRDSRRS